jgi:putative tryptophan/tyrosine transport system substrate-binding protein
MKRREFIGGLGGAAAWPLVARAQSKPPTIGLLGADTLVYWRSWTAAFLQRLQELFWVEGRTVRIEYRWAEGQEGRYAQIATELVRLKVDVIVTQGTPSVLAAKQATSVIPIVFCVGGRSGGQCPRSEARATRRQRHRPVGTNDRHRRQTSRDFT